MTTPVLIPNTFQNKVGTAKLSDLDDNFTALANAINTGAGAPGTVFDGGTPTTIYNGSDLNAGGVT
jgi:hypothetical protein